MLTAARIGYIQEGRTPRKPQERTLRPIASRQLLEVATDSPALEDGLITDRTEQTQPTLYLSASNYRIVRPLFWATLVALAVRLVAVAFTYQSFLDPGRDYWEFGYEMGKIARSIVTGHGFANPYPGVKTGPTAVIGPVYPYLMAGIFAVFGIYTKAAALAMLTVNSLFSALTCIPIFFLAKRSFGLQVARWTTWSWAFFPYAIYLSAGSMWEHTLTAFFLTTLFLIALHIDDSRGLWAWAGFGLLWGVAALTSPIVLGVLPIFLGWACYRVYREGGKWALPAGTVVIALVITLAPWLIRNYRTFHQPVFVRDGFPLVFVVGNVGDTLHWYNPLDPPGNPAGMAEFQRVGEQAYMKARRDEMVAFLESHPGTFAWRSVRRVVSLWTGYWSFNREYLRDEPFDPPNMVFCTGLSLLAVLGLRHAFRSSADVVVSFALLLFVYPLPYYFTLPFMPYRHPLDPVIVILATCAVVSWRQAREQKQHQRLLRQVELETSSL